MSKTRAAVITAVLVVIPLGGGILTAQIPDPVTTPTPSSTAGHTVTTVSCK
jgi:hypothetical protein